MTILPTSPIPGFAYRCEHRRRIEEQIATWHTEGLRAEFLCDRVRHAFGEDGTRILRGLIAASEPPARKQRDLFNTESTEVDPVENDLFSRMALDDLFASAQDLQHMVPLLGFLGRARDNVYNAMVVYVQNPNAREWKTRVEWKGMGRSVREGAKPLLTLFPFGPFRIKYDVADTEGPARDHGPGLLDAEGAVSAEQWSGVRGRLKKHGIHLRETHPMETQASGELRRKGDSFEIALEMRVSLPAQFGTLCHELAHLYLGHMGPDPGRVPKRPSGEADGERAPAPRWPERTHLPLAVQELEAEAVAFLVCTRLGIVTPAAEYMAGYIDQVPDGAAPGVEMMVRAASNVAKLVLPPARPSSKS